MKKIIITILMIILILILVSNFSFATTVTVDDLKVAFNKIFAEDIEIEIDNGDGSAPSIISSNLEGKYTISDNCIVLEDEGCMIKVNYYLEDNKCIFTSNTDIASYIEQVKKVRPEITQLEILFVTMFLPEGYYAIMQECYLGVANAVGVDYSLAYTYFYQKRDQNSEKNNITDSVFNYERTTLENNETSFKLEINLDELAALDWTKVNEFPKATVTLGKIEESKDDNNTNTNFNNVLIENNVVDTNNVSDNNVTNGAGSNTNTNINTNVNTNTNLSANINANINSSTNTNTNSTTNTNINTTNNSNTNVSIKNKVDWSQVRNTLPKTGSNYPLKHTLISIIFIATAVLGLICMYNKKVGMTDETKR